MAFYFFAIPALNPQLVQNELNRFCGAQRVMAVDRHFVAAGLDSYWALCVTVAPGPGPLPAALKASERGSVSQRIDYKTVLSEQDFALFAEFRSWRKTIAEQEGVPIYAVFTNEQLAEIVRRRATTLTALAEIEGIGPARIERYGAAVLTRVRAAASSDSPE